MAIKFLSGISLETNELQHARIHPLSSAPTSPTPVQGQIYYNTGDDTVYTYDGSSWNGLASSGAMTAWILEDDDGTEVSVSNAEEVKFIGSGITTNWTDTSTGSDGDPFDLTFTVDAAQTGITSILATDVKIGEDDQTKIDFETANEIHFYADNAEQVYVADGIFGPQTDSDVDLGTTGVRWKDAFVDSITVTGEVDGASLDISGNADIDGTTNLDAVDIDGAVQLDATFTVGVDDQGYDVKLFGDTASAYLLWDTSADKLLTAGGAVVDIVKDKLLIGGTAVTTTAAELNVLDAVTAGTVTASLGVVVDSNKDIGSFRNITLTGELDAGSLDVSGDADIDGTLEADAITINDTAIGSIYASIEGGSGIVTTGALDSGSITSGFGNIDNGSSTLDTGALTATTGTFVGDMSFTSDTATFTSANTTDPVVIIKNTTNDTKGARLHFVKDKGAAGADNDIIGEIEFIGDDAAQAQTSFVKFLAQVGEADNTDEAGVLSFQVASSDGTTTGLTTGLQLTGHKTSDYVDVTLGSGSSSTVTIPGNLTVSGTTTTVNSTTVTLNDHNIVLDSGNSTSAVVNGAGITIEGGSGDDATFTYSTTGPQFEMKLGSSYEDLQTAKLTATELDISGDVDVDGTLETDAISIGGTDISATAAEINLIDGGTVRGTTAVASGDGILINDGGTMRMTNVDTVSTYFSSHNVGGSNIVTTGALNSGSITSGFGTIDTGSSAITTTGLISGGSLDIDNVLINGTTIGHTDDTDLITLANEIVTVAGEISVTTLDIGGTDVSSTAAELNYNDTGAAVGTVVASKTLTVDANKDIASLRNITLTGELDAGSLDVSGDADIDGTLETDALTIDGTAIVAQATASAVGGVELATAAEVLTGTDTARVVTADTLSAKSVVATIAASSITDDKRVTVTHSLGTADVIVQLYDMTTEANVYADIARTTDDMSTASTSVITIDFGQTTPGNDIRVLITSLAGATAGSLAYT